MAVGSLIFDSCESLWGEEVLIASGASLANPVMTQGHALVGILMPAGWDAANIGYDVSLDNVTWRPLKKAGSFSQTITEAAIFVPVPLDDAVFAPYIRLKSVSVATPTVNTAVNQTADRTLKLIFKRYLGGS